MPNSIPSPTCTCALSLVHDGPEYAPSTRLVHASAFIVTIDEAGPRFSVKSASVLPALNRAEAVAHIAQIVPENSEVLSRVTRLPKGLSRYLAAGNPLPVPSDLTTLRTIREDCILRPFQTPEAYLEAVSVFFGLQRVGQDAGMVRRVAHAGADAQAVYLTYLFSLSADEQRRDLAAAFQAWQIIERNRPLGRFGPAERF